eukprot:362288_1
MSTIFCHILCMFTLIIDLTCTSQSNSHYQTNSPYQPLASNPPDHEIQMNNYFNEAIIASISDYLDLRTFNNLRQTSQRNELNVICSFFVLQITLITFSIRETCLQFRLYKSKHKSIIICITDYTIFQIVVQTVEKIDKFNLTHSIHSKITSTTFKCNIYPKTNRYEQLPNLIRHMLNCLCWRGCFLSVYFLIFFLAVYITSIILFFLQYMFMLFLFINVYC